MAIPRGWSVQYFELTKIALTVITDSSRPSTSLRSMWEDGRLGASLFAVTDLVSTILELGLRAPPQGGGRMLEGRLLRCAGRARWAIVRTFDSRHG